MTLAELKTRHAELVAQATRDEERLKVLKEGTNTISPEEAKKINESYETNRKLWRQRRKMVRLSFTFSFMALTCNVKFQCMDVVNTILENSPMKKLEFYEAVGIETDEAVGVELK